MGRVGDSKARRAGRLFEWLLPLMVAPFVGSLLGVLIERLPAGRPVAMSRSSCNTCGRILGPAEMVPVLSYVALRGRCRGCSAPIGRNHLIVEAAAAAVAVWVLAVQDDPAVAWADCALGWTLLTLAWIDLRHQRLPDVLTLPLLMAGLTATWWLEPWGILGHALGAVIGYAAFWLVAAGYRAWRGRDGLGPGDAKLLAAAGAWVGWDQLNQVVLLGVVVTLGLALWQFRGRFHGSLGVPFGPGLALGLWIMRLHG